MGSKDPTLCQIIQHLIPALMTLNCRPSKPAPRPVVRKNDDYTPSVGRPSAAPNKRPDRDRGGDKGGRKAAGGPSNKPSRDARPADRGRGQPRGDRDKGGAKKEQKVSDLSCIKCGIEGLNDL